MMVSPRKCYLVVLILAQVIFPLYNLVIDTVMFVKCYDLMPSSTPPESKRVTWIMLLTTTIFSAVRFCGSLLLFWYKARYLVRDEDYHLIQCGCCACYPKICGTDFKCGSIHTDLQRRMRVYEILNHLMSFLIAMENFFQASAIMGGFCKSKPIGGVISIYEWSCLFDIVSVFVSHFSYRLTHKSWCCCDACKCTCDYPCKCCSKFLLCLNLLMATLLLFPVFPAVLLVIYFRLLGNIDKSECLSLW